MATAAAQLRAKGQTIRLSDGSDATLRFDMGAIVDLEEMFGTVPKALAALGTFNDEDTPSFTLTGKFLRAGMGWSVQELRQLADPAEIHGYVSAIMAAITEAFPKPDEESEKGEATAPAEKRTKRSPGAVGTTSRPSGSAVLTATSG